jgi:hypothetical protein
MIERPDGRRFRWFSRTAIQASTHLIFRHSDSDSLAVSEKARVGLTASAWLLRASARRGHCSGLVAHHPQPLSIRKVRRELRRSVKDSHRQTAEEYQRGDDDQADPDALPIR